MARFRSVFALSALALAASALAACTPAVSSSAPRDPFASPIVPGQSARASAGGGRATIDAPSPRSGSGTVTVALVGGAQLPTETAQAFTQATGFTVAVVSIDGVGSLPKTSADVVLGLDGADAVAASAAGTIASTAPRDTSTLAGTAVEGAAAAIAYGRDDVCVIADKSWLSANGRSLPTSFADLTSPRVRSLLAVPDPTSSSVGRAFVQEAAAQTGEGLGAFAQSLSPRIDPSLGAAVGVWTAGGHVSQGYVGQLVGGEVEASAFSGRRGGDEHGSRLLRCAGLFDVHCPHPVCGSDRVARLRRGGVPDRLAPGRASAALVGDSGQRLPDRRWRGGRYEGRLADGNLGGCGGPRRDGRLPGGSHRVAGHLELRPLRARFDAARGGGRG